MSERGIRIIDLVVWACVGGVVWAVLLMALGCQWGERTDRALQVAERALDKADQVEEVIGVIAEAKDKTEEAIDEEDWLGVTESVLIGAGAFLSAFGAKKGYDKLKKQG